MGAIWQPLSNWTTPHDVLVSDAELATRMGDLPASQSANIEQVKLRDLIKRIEENGWVLVSQEGSHRQYKHPVKSGKVTVAGKPGSEPPRGTVKSILKQAQIEAQR